MLIKYKEQNFKAATLATIAQANKIIDEYSAAGYTLTVRQIYYQFVARGWKENSERSYNNLLATLTKARLAGLTSWEAIEDRNREHHDYWTQEDDSLVIQRLPNYIRFDQWARQDHYVEVWVEKEALGNVVTRACNRWMVPHMACKGYLSASEAWRAGRRFEEQLNNGKHCVLIHLGDHDPSGIDMTRDNKDRVDLFTQFADSREKVEVRRIALNMDQVEEYAPPPNPTKTTDSRSDVYIESYGEESWELDALEPSVIEDLIDEEISELVDKEAWEEVGELETKMEVTLGRLHYHWPEIKERLENEQE